MEWMLHTRDSSCDMVEVKRNTDLWGRCWEWLLTNTALQKHRDLTTANDWLPAELHYPPAPWLRFPPPHTSRHQPKRLDSRPRLRLSGSFTQHEVWWGEKGEDGLNVPRREYCCLTHVLSTGCAATRRALYSFKHNLLQQTKAKHTFWIS